MHNKKTYMYKSQYKMINFCNSEKKDKKYSQGSKLTSKL